MRTNTEIGAASAAAERLCYYCNEGHCALCTGWDRTVIEGKIVEAPCAHGCRKAQRKANGKATNPTHKLTQRRA